MKENRQRAGKGLMVVGGGIALIALMFGSYWHNLNLMPDIKIPNPVMPSPNARDLFIRAGDGIQDGTKVDYATARRRSSVPAGSMPGGTLTTNTTKSSKSSKPEDHVYTPAEKIALVRENAATLQTFRQGLTLPYQEIPTRSFKDTLPHYAKFRTLARLLSLEAQARATQEDWKGAVDSQLDCIQFGQMVPRGGILIDMMVGRAIQQIGSLQLGNAVAHLTSAQARAAAQRAEAILDTHVPYAGVIQEEKWAWQASLLEMFRSPNWRASLQQFSGQSNDDESDKRGQMERLKDAVKLYFLNRGKVLYDYGQYMDQQIANAHLPVAAQLPEPPIPDDPINQVVAMEYGKMHIRDAQAQAQIAQLALRLALRAYHEDHHQYPRTLDALVPAYLPKLPDDPTALQGGFGYTRDKVGFTLTSGTAQPPQP